MVGWYHRLNGCKFEKALEDSEGQGSLACCSPWGHSELDITERLNSSKTACCARKQINVKRLTKVKWEGHRSHLNGLSLAKVRQYAA